MVQKKVLSSVGFLRLNSGGKCGSKCLYLLDYLESLFLNFRHKKDKRIMKWIAGDSSYKFSNSKPVAKFDFFSLWTHYVFAAIDIALACFIIQPHRITTYWYDHNTFTDKRNGFLLPNIQPTSKLLVTCSRLATQEPMQFTYCILSHPRQSQRSCGILVLIIL